MFAPHLFGFYFIFYAVPATDRLAMTSPSPACIWRSGYSSRKRQILSVNAYWLFQLFGESSVILSGISPNISSSQQRKRYSRKFMPSSLLFPLPDGLAHYRCERHPRGSSGTCDLVPSHITMSNVFDTFLCYPQLVPQTSQDLDTMPRVV